MRSRRLWIGLLALILLTPLGLWLPEKFRAGPAWGEWSPEEVERLVGYVPEGMKKGAELWRSPLADYAPPSLRPAAGYLVSGLLGAAATVAFAFLLGHLLTLGKRKDTAAPREPAETILPSPDKR